MDADVDILGISKRLQKLPGWKSVIEPTRNRMMKECRKQGMLKADAQAWTYAELDRLYQPTESEPNVTMSHHYGGGYPGVRRYPLESSSDVTMSHDGDVTVSQPCGGGL
jgi:hypothetical protein